MILTVTGILKELYAIRDDLPERKEDCPQGCLRVRTRLDELIEKLEAAYTRRI
jgi:hypothetical protein